MGKALGFTRTSLAIGAALVLLGYEIGRWALEETRWHRDAYREYGDLRKQVNNSATFVEDQRKHAGIQ